ncbi:DUF1835 domain-containing protein [Oceanihabitans sp. 2_MG-2023]|uniref:DUF1835 domain-containing protein n=1 Tax=Oceanihabitans sp. 2_MG-2023 TaxID=3062661 RepID=UPI0026E17213|nr:DUF1835 domain-containing protein [Oceanihabitans sp. 2_MG-2023]MDO6598055.1 DUF1835 domain-containing protein [Oceanihabitans sp. 2_MG-2023]
MKDNILHITNGSNLTNYLNDLNYKGDFLTWHEMLCEGPANRIINTDAFIKVRKDFLNEFYNIEVDEYEYKNELHKLDTVDQYSEIVLWFEYDLFCHLNMVAVLSLLNERKINLPISLVCSGRIANEDHLKGLSELTPEQLDSHYKGRIKLQESDRDIAVSVWQIYCGTDHNLLKKYITKKSSFEYLGICLKAHLKRFPDSKTGLSTLEQNTLNIINKYDIKSKHHLLGYALNYQGYYGFGDIQLMRIIENLAIFYTEDNDSIRLNRKGHEVLLGKKNYASEINDNMIYGNVNRLDFQFNKKENKLIKTIMHAN